MPEYIYRCEDGHEFEFACRMFYSTAVVCDCGEEMWRVPQRFTVNWGGPSPSEGEWHPRARRLFETLPERQDKFLEEHEEHERRTANETDAE